MIRMAQIKVKLLKCFKTSGKKNNQEAEKEKPIIKVSANMYDFILKMNLGNLSSLKFIPEFYVNCIMKYIIHVTRAFAHAHQNNVTHGKFNLSKVVAQVRNLEEISKK
jgi:hypothetical protein